jgi:hypothetical protein
MGDRSREIKVVRVGPGYLAAWQRRRRLANTNRQPSAAMDSHISAVEGVLAGRFTQFGLQ